MSSFTPEIGDDICRQLVEGKSLRAVCKAMGFSVALVCKWLADPENEQFREQYARARDAQADTLAEEILDIADNIEETPESRRVRVDVRKWYAGKVRPKKYGDKILHAGPDGETPATFTLAIDQRDQEL